MRISIEYQANKDIFLSFVDFLRSMLGYFTLPLQREDNQIMVLVLNRADTLWVEAGKLLRNFL